MFAVIQIAGKQYQVTRDEVITVSRMEGEAGKTVKADVLLLVDGKNTSIGTPVVKDTVATLKIISHGKGDKINVRRYKSKVRYRRSRGFTPLTTDLQVVSVG